MGFVAVLSRLQAKQLFWVFSILHVVLWTLVPSLVLGNAPLDVIEGLAWGRAWELGYHKHPPLFAWVIEAAMQLSGDRIWSVYLLSQLCVALAFFGVWRLGRRVLGDDRHALVAVLLLEGVYYYGVPTPEFNPLILQMALWALIGWLFHRALTEDRWTDWLLVGALAGLDLLTRYSSGVLLAALGLFLVLHPQARAHLRRPGPYLAAVVAAAIVAPHLAWLIDADFPTFGYIAARAPKVESGLINHLLPPVKFLGAQAAALAPAALLVAALVWPIRRRGAGRDPRVAPPTSGFDRAYVATLALGPAAIAVMLSSALGLGLRSMWGAQMWGCAGILALLWFRPSLDAAVLRRFAGCWGVVVLATLTIFVAIHIVQPQLFDRKKRTAFPGRDLARIVTERWHAATGTPLRFVVGKVWVAGNISVYSPDRPAVFIEAETRLSPWIDPNDVIRDGAVILWIQHGRDAQDPWRPGAWHVGFSSAVVQPPIRLPWHWNAGGTRPLEVGWAILPPAAQLDAMRAVPLAQTNGAGT